MKHCLFHIILALMLMPACLFGQSVSIGDILCTDGSIIKVGQYASSGKTAEGIVFYVDADQTQGLMVALNDASASIPWGSNGDVPSLTNQTCAPPYGALPQSRTAAQIIGQPVLLADLVEQQQFIQHPQLELP